MITVFAVICVNKRENITLNNFDITWSVYLEQSEFSVPHVMFYRNYKSEKHRRALTTITLKESV